MRVLMYAAAAHDAKRDAMRAADRAVEHLRLAMDKECTDDSRPAREFLYAILAARDVAASTADAAHNAVQACAVANHAEPSKIIEDILDAADAAYACTCTIVKLLEEIGHVTKLGQHPPAKKS